MHRFGLGHYAMGVDWSSQEYWTYVQFCDNDRTLELFVDVSLMLSGSQQLLAHGVHVQLVPAATRCPLIGSPAAPLL